ncbi:MAG: regulator, partial [Elusimicrobia bacterium]|nr:regulator [Elusimicrobiota bacterium]
SRLDTRTGAWELFDNTNSIMHEPWCYAVTADSGTVYTAGWGGGVLVRDPQTGRLREHRHPTGLMELSLVKDDGLIHDITTAVAHSRGVLWVGTYFGLSRFDGRRWRNYTQADSGLAGDFINFLRAKGDAVWIATDQGLGRFDSKTWRTWRKKTDGPGFELESTDEKGSRSVEALAAGPACNEVYSVDIDRKGDAWVATAAGLSHGVAR